MTGRRSFGPLSLFLAIFSLSCFSSAFAAPGDFDADGWSDLSVTLVDKNTSANTGTTVWLTRLTNEANPLLWGWNVPGDAFVAGRYFAGDSRFYPGVVWVRSASLPLEWYIKNAVGQDAVVYFGLPGDSIPNQGDIDGDGLTDFTTVRSAGNVLNWYVAFSGSGGQVVQYTFGESGDKTFVSDTDGDGRAEFVVLRPGTYVWYIMRPGDLTFSQMQWGLNGDLPIAPVDMDGDNLVDYIISRRIGAFQVAYIRYGNGQTATKNLGFDTSIPQVGNFVSTTTKGFAWWQRDTGWNAIQNADDSLKLFLFGISTNAIVRADGTVVQPSEDGTFGTADGGGGGGGGGGSIENCTSTVTSGYLYKPESQDSGGTREGYPLILLDDYSVSADCLRLLAANGQAFSCFGKYSAARAYEGWTCGLDDDSPCFGRDSAEDLAAQSQALGGTVGGYVLDPGNGRCYTVPDFSERHDVR